MAWTTPRTWVNGELVDDTLMNTHLRDNLNAVRCLAVRKASTETVTSSTVLQNDNDLLFPIAANEVWVAQAILFVHGATAGDIKVAWSAPSGATGAHGQIGLLDATTQTQDELKYEAHSDLTTVDTAGIVTSINNATTIINSVTIVNSTNAGNVNLQWAQNASSGTATEVIAGSFLTAYRIG